MDGFRGNATVLSTSVYNMTEVALHHINDTKGNAKNFKGEGCEVFQIFWSKHFDGLWIRELIASSESGNNGCGILL